MSPVIANSAVYLSWNSARLLALILNALTGSLVYLDREHSTLSPDAIFGLKLIEGQLDQIYINFKDRGYHADIFKNIRNLSMKASDISAKAMHRYSEKDDEISKILERGFRIMLPPAKKIDERLRWAEKEHFSGKTTRSWFDDGGSGDMRCILDLVGAQNPSCQASQKCQDSMLFKSGLNGYYLTTQLLYMTIAQNIGCQDTLKEALAEKNTTMETHVAEYCSNMISELDVYKKDKKKIARIDYKSLGLMMEQVFVCSLHGFVDFLDTHFIVAALSWQSSSLGCWTRNKADPVRNVVLTGGILEIKTVTTGGQRTLREEACLPHLSTVSIGALVVALRFLLDPPPWPEYHTAADHLISADRIVAEDHFRSFKYISWVRDFPAGAVEFARPPPTAWAPDLIAFVFLLLIILIGFIIAHNFCANHPSNRFGGRQKRLYHFAYKKL